MKRTPLKRGGFIKREGHKTTLWTEFRNKYADKCRDEDGLITCEDGHREEEPDLHHVIGRDERPDLYFAEHNLVWLSRTQHDELHATPKEGKHSWLVASR